MVSASTTTRRSHQRHAGTRSVHVHQEIAGVLNPDQPDAARHGATLVAADLTLYRDLTVNGNNFDQRLSIRPILTPNPDESSMTWCVPWTECGLYFQDDVGPENGVYVIPAGTPDPVDDAYTINVLPLMQDGMTTTLKLKLEPQCTPNPAGNCFTYSQFYSSEYTDLTKRPFLEPTITDRRRHRRARQPVRQRCCLPRPHASRSADGDVYTNADMDGWRCDTDANTHADSNTNRHTRPRYQ